MAYLLPAGPVAGPPIFTREKQKTKHDRYEDVESIALAVKKSELYSSLWASCDELRGGMDASQYKDYVLVLLFIKYVSDKYAGQPYAPITIPPGSSFKDLAALKGDPGIGDKINKNIIGPLAAANHLADMPDFNDAGKLGSGRDMVDRLTGLISIFENKALDFSRNQADGDDILGDAYEYLMRHFATESGKSKGQFYTPSEVSRVIARIVAIRSANTTAQTTVYDPTCGSGSLLLKVADEARTEVTLYGQEKDAVTSGLARMNMILHRNPNAQIVQGNTLANPKFKDGERLKLFDYVVANIPFSDKRWTNGLTPSADPFERFSYFGAPPDKQGDYAYLLHIVASLKSTGIGVCVLPHGVLFRGNSEAAIREKLVRKGYIAAIIGLPANLFYGTGIPACLVVIDKKNAAERKGIFMIDASAGFMKDGPKNRLRDQDIHKLVDVFARQVDTPRYARMVPLAEIEKNGFNLNLPRYIDSQTPEDIQDIAGHLQGGIPERDIDALSRYWAVCPGLRDAFFKPRRPGYFDLAVDFSAIKSTIYDHPEFVAFITEMNAHFETWRVATAEKLKALEPGFHPKEMIAPIADDLLEHYLSNPLIDAYSVYQHLMDYWASTMQDDCYLISSDGWKAGPKSVVEVNRKTGAERVRGWVCDLVPKSVIVARYFAAEQVEIDGLIFEADALAARMNELEAEHNVEGGYLEFDLVNRAALTSRKREIQGDSSSKGEIMTLAAWLELDAEQNEMKRRIKLLETDLDRSVFDKYSVLHPADFQDLIVDDKWLNLLSETLHSELNRIARTLAEHVEDVSLRYNLSLSELSTLHSISKGRVSADLDRMGFTCK